MPNQHILSVKMSSVRSISGPRLSQKARKAVAPRSFRLVVRAGAERVTQSKSDVIVSPSILSANFATLGADVRTHSAVLVVPALWPSCYVSYSIVSAGSLVVSLQIKHVSAA